MPASASSSSSSSASGPSGRWGLFKNARRDPEILVLGVIMVGAYAMFGYYFGRNPTSSTRLGEENINIARNTAPWSAGGGEVENSDRNNYKYMYHPGGDYRNAPKRAPSALNAVIVPGVTLPKELHERFNKYGKDNY